MSGNIAKLKTITVSNPAVGVDWSYTVPAYTTLTVVSLSSKIATGATVGNRRLSIQALTGAGAHFFESVSNANITANSTVLFSASSGVEAVNLTSGLVTVGLPSNGLYLPAGSVIRALTLNDGIEVDDQWSEITLQAVDANG